MKKATPQKRPIDLSVCIVNYNTQTLLENCLTSVFETLPGGNTEVVVVDNASSDGSVPMVRRKFPGARIVACPQNRGYAYAVNRGIENSTGRYFLILNSDVILKSEAMAGVLEFMERTPKAGIAGCRLLNPDGTDQKSCRGFPGVLSFFSESFYLYKLFPGSPVFGRSWMTFRNLDRNQEVDYVIGAFWMVRRKVFDRIGLFDERFFMYSEETDFAYRAKRAGWEVWYIHDVSVVHLGGATTNQQSVPMFVEIHKSHERFIRKHRGPMVALLVQGILCAGVMIRVLALALANAARMCAGSPSEGSRLSLERYWAVLKWYMGFGMKKASAKGVSKDMQN